MDRNDNWSFSRILHIKHLFLLGLTAAFAFIGHFVQTTQADDKTILIEKQIPGVTPFIFQIELSANDTTALKHLHFTIAPKSGSVTRPLSGTYARDYLLRRGYLLPLINEIFLPGYGLYDGYANNLSLRYNFLDGSSKTNSAVVTTAAYDDPCGYHVPVVLQPRSTATALSYDYIMIKGRCSDASPAIIDTDGALRWVGAAGISDISSPLFDNAVFQAANHSLYRFDLDGTITLLHDYVVAPDKAAKSSAALGVLFFFQERDEME